MRASIAALAVAALLVACGTDNGDPEDPDASASTPDRSPSSSGSSGEPDRPTFDASFDDDAGSSTDPTPDGGGDVCVDNDDPGGAENVAKALPNIDDCDSSGGKISGVMNGPVDVDFYKFTGTDTFGCSVDPTVTSSTTGLEVCMFVACTNGTIDFKGCSGGAQKNSDVGDPGCCVATPGSTTLSYNCTGTTKESADVFIRVKQVGNACLKYSLDYHF